MKENILILVMFIGLKIALEQSNIVEAVTQLKSMIECRDFEPDMLQVGPNSSYCGSFQQVRYFSKTFQTTKSMLRYKNAHT